MSTIRIIYHGHEPNFPATDQHPDAKRYYVLADGTIYEAVAETDIDKAVIESTNQLLTDKAAVMSVRADELAGASLNLALTEKSEAAPDVLAAATRVVDAAQASFDAAAQEYGEITPYVFNEKQRAYLARLTDPLDRRVFLAYTSKERNATMAEASEPTYVIDALDGPPTAAEIAAVLNPPKVKSPPTEVELLIGKLVKNGTLTPADAAEVRS